MREAELKVNLEILLLGEHEKDSNQQIEFPDETESLGTLETYRKLKDSDNGNEKSDHLAASVPLNEPCTVIWDLLRGREWYSGMAGSIIEEGSLVI